MIVVQEHVLLSPYTTLGVGGRARFFVDCTTEEGVVAALSYARELNLPVSILGGGSNILVPDAGFAGMVIKISIGGTAFKGEESPILIAAGAGVSWDTLVDEAAERNLWGIENLAGIPGTVGGAAVQNIGAYGAELSEVFVQAEAIDIKSGALRTISPTDAEFGYRTSIFKTQHSLIITRVTLTIATSGIPRLMYPDLQKAVERGESLMTPGEIGEAVRRIRALKFPRDEGTAGSFFKNPILTTQEGEKLKERFPDLPLFPFSPDRVKVPLAWILDRALDLKGYARGNVRLFETQPLVIVTREGARAEDVEKFANEIRDRVHDATGILIEREVETLTAR